MDYDDIVVGAGSAGAVLAARLSEDPQRSVLLLEAGPDYRTIDETPHNLLRTTTALADHNWGWVAQATPQREIPFPPGQGDGRLFSYQLFGRDPRGARGFRPMGRVGQQ